MKRWIIGLALVALFTAAARAEDPWDSSFFSSADEALWLRGVTSVYIFILDEAVDGCWTNESAVRTAIELSLRGAGIAVETDNVVNASHILLLSVKGADWGSGCVGTVKGKWLETGRAVS